jgi:hypothetical protein
MSKALQFIHAVARKFLAKEGKGITSIANRMRAEAKASEIATTFQESGLPLSRLDEFIKSENDVVKYLNIIESKKSEAASNNMMDIVRRGVDKFKTKKSADVLDLKGNRIKNTDNIMGGEEIKIKDPALYEDRGGNIIPAQFKNETDEQIKKRLMDQNKKSLDSMKKKLDEPDDMASGGRAGFALGSMVNQAPLTPAPSYGEPQTNNVAQGRESFFGQPLFDKDGFRLGDQRYGTGLVGGPQMALPGLTNQTPGGPMQSPTMGFQPQATFNSFNQIGSLPGNFQPTQNVAPGTQPQATFNSFDQIVNPDLKDQREQALLNLNNEFFPTPSYDPPQVPEEQKITDPYQRAGDYKRQQDTTPVTTPDEVRNKGNTVAQAFGAKPGALNQALGLAYGGRAGLYQGGQAQIEPDLSGIGHGSDALMARNMLIAPGSQATTSTGLNYLLGEDNDTTRVPYKEKGSVTLADLIKVNASGSKSGKNQIMGAPDGITADTETFNAIIKMDIPIMEKINLLGSYGYGKDRFKVEKGNKELFLGEGGYKDRNIGLGVNQGGEGLSGSVIRNLETGDNDYQLKFLKSFAEGGRIGYNEGNMVLPKPKAMDEYLLQQVMSQAGANTLDVRTREMFIEQLKKKIRDKRATEEKKYQFEELRDQGAEDMYYNNREKELDIKYNPQNYPPSMRKFAGGGVAGLLGEGPRSTDNGPRTMYAEGQLVQNTVDGSRPGYSGKKAQLVQEVIQLIKNLNKTAKLKGLEEKLIKKVNKLFNKEVVTTADKLPIPKKTLDRDMFNAANKRLNKKRQLTDTEIQDYEMELGDSETWMSEGTLGEAENALKNYKAYQDDMFRDYKAGKLDPVAGDKSPARKKFLQQKFDEMESSGDPKLMTRDEIEELTFFDLGTEMDNFGLSSAEKKGKKLADSMSDAEIDLRDEFPGIEDRLIKQILTDDNPQRVAEVKQTMRRWQNRL